MSREHWRSRLGFIWSAVGSAVGLGNIWRFPYVVGENGGATFIMLYLICLILVGFPVLVSEILIGRTTQSSPPGAFKALGKSKSWKRLGIVTVITGFLVTTFYGVISGMTFGYLIEAIFGKLSHLDSASAALTHYEHVSHSFWWMIFAYTTFTILSLIILVTGVRKGIEASNKVMMPLLFILLLFLVVKGLLLPGAEGGIKFLFQPDWSSVKGKTIIMALGQAFFALSLGQGTMVTYGSYLKKTENIPGTCLPISVFGTFVSLMAGIAIFTIVFSVGVEPTAGPSLMFQTLPVVFAHMKAGYFIALIFFVLLFLAGVTSQISALEPAIAYLIDGKKWARKKAVIFVGLSSFLLGIPSMLSFGMLSNSKLFGLTIFELVSALCVNILIPIGGLLSVVLIGWRWGILKGVKELEVGFQNQFSRHPVLRWYFHYGIKYIAPLLIIVVMLDLFKVFG